MKGWNFLDKKEQILDLYFNKHLKQIEIAEIVNASQQYISKIIKNDKRYENEKSFRKSSNAEKRKITQAEYQKNYVRRKEKDIVYEQLLEQQKQDSIELSYNPHPSFFSHSSPAQVIERLPLYKALPQILHLPDAISLEKGPPPFDFDISRHNPRCLPLFLSLPSSSLSVSLPVPGPSMQYLPPNSLTETSLPS